MIGIFTFLQVTLLVIVLVSGLIYLYIYYRSPNKYLALWCVTFFYLFIGDLIITASGEEGYSLLFSTSFYILANLPIALFICWAIYLFINVRFSRGWIYGTLISAFWILIGNWTQFGFLVTSIPISIFLMIMYVFAGARCVTQKGKFNLGKIITGSAILSMGLFSGLFPAFSLNQEWYPWSLIITTLSLTVGVIGLLVFYFEGTESRLAAKEKSLQEAKTAAELANQAKSEFLANMSDALILADPNYIIKGSNIAATELLGFGEIELLGKSAKSLFCGDSTKDTPLSQNCIAALFHSDQIRDLELEISRKDGKKIPVLLSKTKLIDPEKNLQAYLFFLVDQTEKKQAEENRKLLQKLSEADHLKTTIITWAAHELKTPLTPIYAAAGLLHQAKGSGKSIDQMFEYEDFASLHRNADRLLKIIDNFLDVGRLQEGFLTLDLAEHDIADLIKTSIEVVKPHANKKSIQIIATVPSTKLQVDCNRLEQVFINILTNAIKFSPENTTVTINTQTTQENSNNMFIIQVRDQGYGFTSEELQHTFQPFAKIYTQQDQKRFIAGTGLGLFISKSIVEGHSGKLSISSDGINKGTTVTISLPVKK